MHKVAEDYCHEQVKVAANCMIFIGPNEPNSRKGQNRGVGGGVLVKAQNPAMDNPLSSRSPRCTLSEKFNMSNFHPIPCDVIIVFISYLQ